MDLKERQSIENSCTQCLLGYYTRLDQRKYDQAIEFLTPDAVWLRLGQPLNGVHEIAEALKARFPNTVVWHSLSNIYFEEVGPQLVRATALNTVYTGKPGPESATLVVRAIVRLNPRFRKAGSSWLIEFLDGTTLMTQSEA